MSKSRKKGLRIGKYRITPLGVGVLVALLLAAAAAVAFSLAGGKIDLLGIVPSAPTATPTAAPTAEPTATPVPTAKPTAAPTAEPTATPEPAARNATIRVLGEISMELDLLKSAYNKADQTFDFSPMFSEIADEIGNTDYTIADVEGTLGDTKGFEASDKSMLTPSALLTALTDSGVDMLMLANDHALDGGFEELQATIANVSAAGLDYVGASTSAEAKSTPVVKDIAGIKVGFVGYCEKMGVKVSGDAEAYGVNLVSNSNAVSDIQAARAAGAEVVIALFNWGDKYSHELNENQQKLAQFLAASGADAIIGYNPHAVQPASWIETTAEDGTIRRTLCLGAPGSLLSNQRKAGTDCGMIFEITLAEQEDGSIAIEVPKYVPTYTLRYDKGEGLYEYRAVAINRYLGEGAVLTEGMTSTDVEYMTKLQSAIQSVVGADAEMISE